MSTILPKSGPGARFASAKPELQRFLAEQGVVVEGAPAVAELEPPLEQPPPPISSSPPLERPPAIARRRRGPQHRHEKLSAAARRARRVEREGAYENRLRDRLHARIVDAGGDPSGRPSIIPERVWKMAWSVVGDASGQAARAYLRTCKNKPAAGAIVRACENGGRYSWAQLRARRIAAFGLALVELGALTKRQGPWASIVMTVGRGAFCALLRDPYERDHARGTPATTTLFGKHRADGTVENGQLGYFKVLRAAGLCYRQQLPSLAHLLALGVPRELAVLRCALPCEVYGPTGRATNRYWIVADSPELVHDDELRAQIVELERTLDAAREAWRNIGKRRRPPLPAAAPPT